MSTVAFDTLAFAKALEAGGISRQNAEAHANAVRDHVMRDIATKADIEAAMNRQTIRLGTVVVACSGLLFAALALLP